jgi:hypothetical protein
LFSVCDERTKFEAFCHFSVTFLSRDGVVSRGRGQRGEVERGKGNGKVEGESGRGKWKGKVEGKSGRESGRERREIAMDREI